MLTVEDLEAVVLMTAEKDEEDIYDNQARWSEDDEIDNHMYIVLITK